MLKNPFIPLACLASWLVVMPVLAIGSLVALLLYALGGELHDALLGRRNDGQVDVRQLARRVCLGI